MIITVVGDVLLDVDITGTADRLSPDAPVPVVEVQHEHRRAGGAGLVASMLAGDGHDVRLVTVLSTDDRAPELRSALSGITVIAGDSGAPTPVKTRLRASGHAIVRIDTGCAPAPIPDVTEEMIGAIESADVLVVADYGRGLTSNPLLWQALHERGRAVPLVWDPHPHGATPVSTAIAVTPNMAEATGAAKITGDDIPAAARAAALLRDRWQCGSVIVTLGHRGALIDSPFTTDGLAAPVPLVIPAPVITVTDPCGAGDRLAATLAVELGRGAAVADALQSAVSDAAAFLAAGGDMRSLRASAPHPFGGAASPALQIARHTRLLGGTVVATGGCFDLMHAGHAHTLSAARALGDCLIVCLNSDESVRRLKGADRPIVQQQDRVDLLLALECVDAVLVFDEDTPEAAIRRLEPDLWVKGGDYHAADLPESLALAEWGGQTVTVPYYRGRSTSKLAVALATVG